MTPQLCVRVCLCSRYLGSVHPTYLCQLKLPKPIQLGVHTGDNTHTVHCTHTQRHHYQQHTCRTTHSESLPEHDLSLDVSGYVRLSLSPLFAATPASCWTLPVRVIPSFLLLLCIATSVFHGIFQQSRCHHSALEFITVSLCISPVIVVIQLNPA